MVTKYDSCAVCGERNEVHLMESFVTLKPGRHLCRECYGKLKRETPWQPSELTALASIPQQVQTAFQGWAAFYANTAFFHDPSPENALDLVRSIPAQGLPSNPNAIIWDLLGILGRTAKR